MEYRTDGTERWVSMVRFVPSKLPQKNLFLSGNARNLRMKTEAKKKP